MSVSVIPALLTWLAKTMPDKVPGETQVYLGPGVSLWEGNALWVGVSTLDLNATQASATSDQDYPHVSQHRRRDEEGDVNCYAIGLDASDQAAALEHAHRIVESVAALCRPGPYDDLTFPQDALWLSFGKTTNWHLDQDESGALALCDFKIHFKARI